MILAEGILCVQITIDAVDIFICVVAAIQTEVLILLGSVFWVFKLTFQHWLFVSKMRKNKVNEKA